jgi:Domain of unknown function (DUF4184)
MPFTPLHCGPAAILKAAGGRHFSLTVFCFSQIAIDLEPLIRIIRDDSVLHGFSHSYVGATLVGLAAVILGKPFCEFVLGTWNVGIPLQWLSIRPTISWVAAISGAFSGVYSHVFLDSIMHADMRPWAPFSEVNGLLYVIPASYLNLLCLGAGVLGVLTLIFIFLWNKWTIKI